MLGRRAGRARHQAAAHGHEVRALDDGWLYVGGTNNSSLGGRNFIRVDADTGALDDTWAPLVNNRAEALAISGERVLVGGSFTASGVFRRIAAVDLDSDRVASSFSPSLASNVSTVAAAGGWVYYATAIGGTGVRRVSAETGAPDPLWSLDAVGDVRALVAQGTRVYAVGEFTFAGGRPAGEAIAFDAGSGAIDPAFAPNTDGTVEGLLADGGTLYLRGTFTQVGGKPRAGLAAVSATTGAVVDGFLPPKFDGPLSALAVASGRLTVAGPFTTAGTTARSGLAALYVDTAVWRADLNNPPASLTPFAGRLLVVTAATTLNGAPLPGSSSILALDPASAAPDTGFRPAISGITALVA